MILCIGRIYGANFCKFSEKNVFLLVEVKEFLRKGGTQKLCYSGVFPTAALERASSSFLRLPNSLFPPGVPPYSAPPKPSFHHIGVHSAVAAAVSAEGSGVANFERGKPRSRPWYIYLALGSDRTNTRDMLSIISAAIARLLPMFK